MRQDLLEILAEPLTGAALRLERPEFDDRGDIESGTLVSAQTGRSYPIVRGIPRFVPAAGYADNFGMQWNKFREVQIDAENGHELSRKRFDVCPGWTAAELNSRLLLDAGCGAGRFAEVAAARGARVVALDISSAVEAARRTLTRFDRADVVQASITAAPFRPGTFDFAYSIGVVQHTPDPPETIASVVRLVRPDGHFGFTIYGRKPWTKLFPKYLLRPLTRRLPPPLLLRLIEGSMPVLFPVTDALFRIPGAGRFFRFALPVATYVDADHARLPRELRYREAIMDTFDMFAPRYDSPMTAEEVETVFRGLNVREHAFRDRAPVNCVGVR